VLPFLEPNDQANHHKHKNKEEADPSVVFSLCDFISF
jgi:hypothetical protein